MKITLIVAASENHAIGHAGDLPWRLRADMQRFRATTIGHPVIMGRRTWDSLPAPLVDRINIILSRSLPATVPGGVVVRDPEGALQACGDATESFIIGGGEIYRMFLDRADAILLTRVHAVVDGDVFFPELDHHIWTRKAEDRHAADEKNDHAMTFEHWVRR